MILMRRGQWLSWAHDMLLDASRSTTGTVLLHTSDTAHFLLGAWISFSSQENAHACRGKKVVEIYSILI